jgi:hypothetical protein
MMRCQFRVMWCCLCLLLFTAVSLGQPSSDIGYPMPSEPNQLFFLQRSMNSNTIVYAARLRPDGKLDHKTPIEVFWRRYSDNGEKLPLSFVERQLAFGVNTKRAPGDPTAYLVTMKAYAKRGAMLRIVDGVPRLEAKVSGQNARLISAYLHLDESENPPRVIKVDLRGEALDTRELLLETFIP